MKIAVLLFGHLRNFETCADSLREHVLSKYDCDVFMHTWDERDAKTYVWHSQLVEPTKVGDSERTVIESLYNPKMLSITHQEKMAEEQYVESTIFPGKKFSMASVYFLMETMNKANELRKQYEAAHNVKYDYVIVTRPDIMLHSDFDIIKIIDQINYFGLDIRKCRFFANFSVSSKEPNATLYDCASDVLFFAKPEVVDKFISANRNIGIEYFKQQSMGTNSTFVRREIEAGITPVPISFRMGDDWSFSVPRVSNMNIQPPQKSKSGLKVFMLQIMSFVLMPFAYIFKRYPGLNRYRK